MLSALRTLLSPRARILRAARREARAVDRQYNRDQRAARRDGRAQALADIAAGKPGVRDTDFADAAFTGDLRDTERLIGYRQQTNGR